MDFVSKAIDGSGKTFSVPGNEGLGVAVETITGVITLAADQSGKTLVLNAAEGVAVTLPALAAGLKYKFVVGAVFATTAWTVVASTNVIQGGAIVNSVNIPAVNENTISFVATAETVGDYVEIECDGTNWYATGIGFAAGGITFTAP